jgi:transposase
MLDQQPSRAQVLTSALTGSLTNAEAARQLGLSVRQVRRLKGALAQHGAAALVHGNRGRRSPRRLPDELRARLLELASTTYVGSNHTELRRLLAEREGIHVARSTLRRVLAEADLRSPYRRRAPRLPAGTMPVALDLVQRRISLLDLQGADYREPSFQQTLDRWRRERPSALRFEIGLDVFTAAARHDPGRRPDGFVFSIGPYDAAPLAAMMSAPDEHLVVKESPVVSALLSGLLNAGDAARRREREALVALTLPFMFRPTRPAQRRLFFKLSSWNIRLASTLLSLFPSTPAVCVYRPIGATVASLLARPPGWQDLLGRPRAVQVRFFPSLGGTPAQAPLSAAAFYAHTWRSGVEQALGLPPERLLLIEHGDLAADPAGALERLLDHVGLAPEPELLAAMTRARSGSSREPDVQPTLTPQQQAEVLAVVGELPRRLAERLGHAAQPGQAF